MFSSWVSSCLLHTMGSAQIMSSYSLFCTFLISYQITLGLIYSILSWKQIFFPFFVCYFSETLITTVSKFIKTCNHALVCLYLTDVELSHKGVIKVSFSFGPFLTSLSPTSYSIFWVHCVPLVEPRLSSSHVLGVSLRNPKIKLGCQGLLVKVWDIWVTHHHISSPKDFSTFYSTPLLHSLSTFCLPQMPRSPLEGRHLPWFILEAAPPHTRKKENMGAEVRVKGASIMHLEIESWNIHSFLAFSKFSPWYPPNAVYNISKHMTAVTWLFFT